MGINTLVRRHFYIEMGPGSTFNFENWLCGVQIKYNMKIRQKGFDEKKKKCH